MTVWGHHTFTTGAVLLSFFSLASLAWPRSRPVMVRRHLPSSRLIMRNPEGSSRPSQAKASATPNRAAAQKLVLRALSPAWCGLAWRVCPGNSGDGVHGCAGRTHRILIVAGAVRVSGGIQRCCRGTTREFDRLPVSSPHHRFRVPGPARLGCSGAHLGRAAAHQSRFPLGFLPSASTLSPSGPAHQLFRPDCIAVGQACLHGRSGAGAGPTPTAGGPSPITAGSAPSQVSGQPGSRGARGSVQTAPN